MAVARALASRPASCSPTSRPATSARPPFARSSRSRATPLIRSARPPDGHARRARRGDRRRVLFLPSAISPAPRSFRDPGGALRGDRIIARPTRASRSHLGAELDHRRRVRCRLVRRVLPTRRALRSIFPAWYEETAAVIAGQEIVKLPERRRDVPESFSPRSGRCPRSRRPAAPSCRTSPTTPRSSATTARPSAPKARPSSGSATTRPSPQFSPLKLKTGQWPEGPQQVAIDADTAAAENFQVGDSVAVSTLGTKHRYEVTGIATFGGIDSLGGATIAIWTCPTAQTLLGKEGQLRRDLDRRQGGHLRRRAHPRRPAAGPRDPGDQALPAAGGGGRQRDQRHRERHPLLPARLRRNRAVVARS